jgi:hypothetical protein
MNHGSISKKTMNSCYFSRTKRFPKALARDSLGKVMLTTVWNFSGSHLVNVLSMELRFQRKGELMIMELVQVQQGN